MKSIKVIISKIFVNPYLLIALIILVYELGILSMIFENVLKNSNNILTKEINWYSIQNE